MKLLFPGYYKPTEEEFKKLWDDAIFIFDTNVLLDIYRFSKNTKKTLINVIQFLDDRIWIPYRVAVEYHRNLNVAISEQLRNYDDTIKKISDLDKHISHSRHPFINEKDVHKEIKAFCNQKLKQLKRDKKNIEKLIINNPIKERLAILLTGKIGECPSKEEIEKILKEGPSRFDEKIPPGFEDYFDPQKKGNDRFGDLLIWKEILKKSKTEKRDIIFVTNDGKEDWYLSHSGKTLGPHPLLIDEFIKETKRNFYCYQTKQFLKYYSQHFTKEVGNDVLMEVESDYTGLQTFSSLFKLFTGETANTGSTNRR